MLYSHSISDKGLRRQENEDYFSSWKSANVEVFVICDGMGGHSSGSLASKLACESFIEYIKTANTTNYQLLLCEAIIYSNQCVYKKSQECDEYRGMGTTLVTALISENKLYFAHVGDSRLYLSRKENLQQLTEDHSFVQKMLKAGILNENEAKNHPRRNEITKALGLKDSIKPSFCEQEINLLSEDKILLCTDGLSNMLSEDKIKTILSLNLSSEEKVNQLISESNASGGYDNITASLIELEIDKALVKTKKWKSFLWILPMICLLIILLLIFQKSTKEDKSNKKFVPENRHENPNLKTEKQSIDTLSIVNSKEKQVEISTNKKISYDLSCMSDDSDIGTTDLINFISSSRDEMIDATVVKISAKQEMEFGKRVYEDLSKNSNLKTNSRLSKILSVLVKNLKNSPYMYHIYEIEDKNINAFTVGAYIFVNSGMINFAKSNDELASVIAHEIHHNELGHITRKLSLSEFSKSIVGEDVSKIGQNIDAFIGASFNQKDELVADLCSIDLIILSGFNPCASSQLWIRMSKNESEYDPFKNLLRSHPYSSKRANCVKHHLITNYNLNCD